VSFTAKYFGACTFEGCATGVINPGDEVEFVSGTRDLVHVECITDTSDEPQRNERKCTECWQIHAGECP